MKTLLTIIIALFSISLMAQDQTFHLQSNDPDVRGTLTFKASATDQSAFINFTLNREHATERDLYESSISGSIAHYVFPKVFAYQEGGETDGASECILMFYLLEGQVEVKSFGCYDQTSTMGNTQFDGVYILKQ